MRVFTSRVFSVAQAWLVLAALQTSAGLAAENAQQDRDRSELSPVDQLVREALLAEASGNSGLRAEKLKQALVATGEAPAAHWLAGHVQVGARWLSVDAAAKEAAQSRKIEEYRKQRDRCEDTIVDHLALARFCAKTGLKDQERGHLIIALHLDPNCKEAIAKLGLVYEHRDDEDGNRSRDQLVTREQFELRKSARTKASASIARWTPAFQKLRRRYETNPRDRDEVLDFIRDLRSAALDELRGIAALTKLRQIRLANLYRLQSLAGIEYLQALESLDLERCRKIGAIDQIAALENLKALRLSDDGEIASLKPMFTLCNLQWLTLCESTNILDGDLTGLLGLHKLDFFTHYV